MRKTMSLSEKTAALATKQARTVARKDANRAANAAQHQANLGRIKELGLDLRMVDDRRPPRRPHRMSPSKALRLFVREFARR